MPGPKQASPRDVDSVARQATNISTLPGIAVKIMQLAGQSQTSVAELEQTISGDPALAAKLLKTVNATAYGLRQKITTLHKAIAFLGSHAVRDLATALSVSTIFQKQEQIGPYCRVGLWRHMVAVGLCSRLVAKHCRLPNFEDASLAGLLHDIGIILEDQYDHGNFEQMLLNLADNQQLAQQERKHLGYAHTHLGTKIAEAWKMPEFIQNTIRFHHASQLCHGEGAPIVRSVEVANYLCSQKGMTSVGKNLCKPPSDEVLRSLDLCEDDFENLLSQLDEALEKNQDILQLF